MQEVIKQLKQLNEKMPSHLSRENAGLNLFTQGFLGTIESWSNPVEEVQKILLSQEMTDLINSGHITIGMIKPRLDLYMNKTEVNFAGDADLAKYLENQITTLEPVFSVSMKMTREMVEEFYGRTQPDGGASPMENMKSHADKSGKTVWDEFTELMDSGPVTFLFLYDQDGEATPKWRKEMGTKFKVEWLKEHEPQSLRARFAIDSYNNLLHGSDGKPSVIVERNFVAAHIAQYSQG